MAHDDLSDSTVKADLFMIPLMIHSHPFDNATPNGQSTPTSMAGNDDVLSMSLVRAGNIYTKPCACVT
jgi:hypothetical protein